MLIKYALYNKWSNEIVLNIIENKTDDNDRNKTIVSSFPSILKTVYHIWDAEFLWLNRLKGVSLYEWPSKNFSGKFGDARNAMLQNDQQFIDFVTSCSDEKLKSDFTYQNIEGKTYTNSVWQSILHCFNHSTYHRGQLITMLRQIGITEIPSTDFITYCRI